MPKPKKDAKRQRRITMEIIVDAYGTEEQAMSWYYYVEEKLQFPFTATCIVEKAISPSRKGDEVQLLEMPQGQNTEPTLRLLENLVFIPSESRSFGRTRPSGQ